MPRRDGTGPLGMGPMTGRGLGNCSASAVMPAEGFAKMFGFGRRAGRGFGCGFGRGFGFRRNGFFGSDGFSVTPDEELSVLKNQENVIENTLKNIKERISELEKE